MSGSDARPFEVAESSSLRVLWVLLPLLAVLGVGMWAQLHDNRSDAPWMEVTLSPPFFLMGGSAAWSLAVIVLMIPLYVVMRSLGQLNSLTGVIVAAGCGAVVTLMPAQLARPCR